MKLVTVLVLASLAFPTHAAAQLLNEELDSIGRFLWLDFMSLREVDKRVPLTLSFMAKDTGQREVITDEEIEGVKGKLLPGIYRKVVIINEISGVGGVVRYAYLSTKNTVFWAGSSNSLLHFQLRPELGNTGVLRLMDNTPRILSELFNNCQKGNISRSWRPSDTDLDSYISSINAIETVLLNRP